MEKAITYLTQHPFFFVIAVIISLMILFSSLRKIMGMFLLLAALFVLYAAYLQISGGHVPELFKSFEQTVGNWFHLLGDLFTWLFSLLKFPKKGMV